MPTFTRPSDTAAEEALANLIAERWRCNVHRYPHFHGVDFYAEREGRVVATFELKVRGHLSTAFPTVFLSLNKWLALLLSSAGGAGPAFYVVQFLDGIKYINAADVYAGGVRPGEIHVKGRPPRPGSANDREPIIEVPVAHMTDLEIAP